MGLFFIKAKSRSEAMGFTAETEHGLGFWVGYGTLPLENSRNFTLKFVHFSAFWSAEDNPSS